MGANEWAKRLGINDAASLETFKQKFSQLEDAAKECPVPPKDGSRCALCRRKVMLDTRFKELCNGLCSAGGSTKSTKKTINAVNSASKILEIYRSLPAAGAGAVFAQVSEVALFVAARAHELELLARHTYLDVLSTTIVLLAVAPSVRVLHGDVLAGYLADYEVRASAPSFFGKFQISSSRFLGELFIDIQY